MIKSLSHKRKNSSISIWNIKSSGKKLEENQHHHRHYFSISQKCLQQSEYNYCHYKLRYRKEAYGLTSHNATYCEAWEWKILKRVQRQTLVQGMRAQHCVQVESVSALSVIQL